MEKQIKICENATLKVMPDTTVLSLSVKAEDEKYNTAVELASDYLDEISDTLVEVGVLRDDIKTEGFNVRPRYERIEDKNGNCRNVLVAYVCTHSLALEFGCDAEFLSNIISALSTLDSMPDISASFKLNNIKDAEAELIEMLSTQAKFKAEAFCSSLGVKLGRLLSVEYTANGEGYAHYPTPLRTALLSTEREVFTADVVPKEIVLNESACYVWEIV